MVRPETLSPDLIVVQLRAASVDRFVGVLTPVAIEGGNVIDFRYQYFARERVLKRYCPGARLRKVKSPWLSGVVGVPRDQRNCGLSLAAFFSLCHGVIKVSPNNGRRLPLHSGTFDSSSAKRPLIEPSGFVVNSIPVTSAPLTLIRRGSETAKSPPGKNVSAVTS